MRKNIEGAKWAILQAIAEEGPISARKIAKRAKATLPAISQTTQLLEAQGLITRNSVSTKRKPRFEYELQKSFTNITLCTKGFSRKVQKTLSPEEEIFLRVQFLPRKEVYWVKKFIFTIEHLLPILDGIAFIDNNPEEVHFLIITNHITQYREEYSTIVLEKKVLDEKSIEVSSITRSSSGKKSSTTEKSLKLTSKTAEKRKAISWSHTVEELSSGIKNGEEYFLKFKKNPIILFDPNNKLRKVVQ